MRMDIGYSYPGELRHACFQGSPYVTRSELRLSCGAVRDYMPWIRVNVQRFVIRIAMSAR